MSAAFIVGLMAGIGIGTIFGLWLADAPECDDDIDWSNAS